jgi:O-antigen ligase
LAEWISSVRINSAALYGAAAVAILLGLIFTRSRAGVALAMLGILLCTVMFSRRLGGKNAYGLVGTFTAIGIGLALLIGLAPVLSRFTHKDPFEDGRWSIFSSTLQVVGQFFPLGSGSGTFAEIYRRFQTADMPGFVNRAHNDYLEWVLEGGLIMAGMLVVFFGAYLRQWPKVWTADAWSPFQFAQVAAGIALLMMPLHSVVDFNLHIPANAVYFAFLAGVFFHRYKEKAPAELRRPRRKIDQAVSIKPRSLPPENAVNPFAD